MKVKMLEEKSGQELVSLACSIMANQKNEIALIINNQELLRFFIEDFEKNNHVNMYTASHMLYFEYNNKKYFTDKFSKITVYALTHYKKEFSIIFNDNNGVQMNDIYTFPL